VPKSDSEHTSETFHNMEMKYHTHANKHAYKKWTRQLICAHYEVKTYLLWNHINKNATIVTYFFKSCIQPQISYIKSKNPRRVHPVDLHYFLFRTFPCSSGSKQNLLILDYLPINTGHHGASPSPSYIRYLIFYPVKLFINDIVQISDKIYYFSCVSTP
jgi:hypothetical protein